MRREKTSDAEVAKIQIFYPGDCEEGKKKFRLVFLLHLKLVKVAATVCDKCLVKMQKALNL